MLTDRPDAMLKVSKNENILLSTQRTPIIYNGSKDVNFCRVTYKGPGFRTHEDELLEERRNLMSKFGGVDGGAAIAIAGGPPVDARRGDTTGKDENNVKYDVNGEEEDIINDITTEEEASQEIDLSLRLVQVLNWPRKSKKLRNFTEKSFKKFNFMLKICVFHNNNKKTLKKLKRKSKNSIFSVKFPKK